MGLVLLLAALGVAAWQVALLGPERARELLQQTGAWAPVVYVLSFALLEPFGVMGIFFVGPGSLIWEFDFDWRRTGSESSYRVFMQLGDGALMDDGDQSVGVGINLQDTKVTL